MPLTLNGNDWSSGVDKPFSHVPMSVPCKINNLTAYIAPSCIFCFVASVQLLCFEKLQENKKPSQVI